ncbi:MAG: addiction module toxin RelE [Gallionellales bacterium RIFCSPHIGHO2_02_FULL_57_16]|nr:MAG: addiction module toxin RelE [Gallionellales bacterium RIFCSPHIGHO2_02_FULL_57_16]
MRILTTTTFDRIVKKLHRQEKADLDDAVRAVADNTEIGEAKVGDLAGIRIYKFKKVNQLCLLAYRVLDEDSIKLLTVGSHENFYRDLKRQEN